MRKLRSKLAKRQDSSAKLHQRWIKNPGFLTLRHTVLVQYHANLVWLPAETQPEARMWMHVVIER